MIDRANVDVANATLSGFVSRPHTHSALHFLVRLLQRADSNITGKVLAPRNPPMHGPTVTETTYHADYCPPYPYEMKTAVHSDYADKVSRATVDNVDILPSFPVERSEVSGQVVGSPTNDLALHRSRSTETRRHQHLPRAARTVRKRADASRSRPFQTVATAVIAPFRFSFARNKRRSRLSSAGVFLTRRHRTRACLLRPLFSPTSEPPSVQMPC